MKSINTTQNKGKEKASTSSLSENVREMELEVFGRVQGVNFRNTIKSFADALNIKGYVINRKGGSVFLVAQGKKEELDKLQIYVKGSPGFSKVDNVSSSFKNARARYSGFEVIRNGNFLSDQAQSLMNLGKSLVVENRQRTPKHIVIIPDGNRRWARERGIDATYGHHTAASYEHIISLFDESREQGVKYLSLWGFSTENWNRDEREIKSIFDLIYKGIETFRKEAHEKHIRFRHLGRKDRLPKDLIADLAKLEEETSKYDDFNVQLCLDYGGRDELIRSINKIISSGVKSVDEESLNQYLDTTELPDPDLIIRTSGEKRTSGFMPYQAAYAELYFCDFYFPDFDYLELRKAIKSFGKRIRRFGGTAKEDLK